MKKRLFVLIALSFLFVIPSVVKAAPTLESMIKVIKDGDITNEYKSKLGKEYHDFVIKAYINDSTGKAANVEISVQKDFKDKKGNVTDTKTYANSFTILTDTEHNYIYTENEYKDEDLKKEESMFINFYYKSFPLWGVEASDKYKSDVVPLLNDKTSKTEQLEVVVDRCYFSEYGLCYTTLPNTRTKTSTLTGKVELTDKGANYVINKLQENIRKEKQEKLMIKLLFVLVILIVLFLIAKLSGGNSQKKRVLKY